jgi:hypothetical protein
MGREYPNTGLGRTTGGPGLGRTTGGQWSPPRSRGRGREFSSAPGTSSRMSGGRDENSRGENSRITKKKKGGSNGFFSGLLRGYKPKHKTYTKSGEDSSDIEPLIGESEGKEKPKKVVSRTLTALLHPEQVRTVDGKAPRRSTRTTTRRITRKTGDGYERTNSGAGK